MTALDEAAAAYERLLAGDATDAEALCRLALIRAGQRRFDEALALALRAAALRPGLADAQAQAGGLLSAMGRPREALGFLKRAHAAAPRRPEILNNLGAALRALGRDDEALAHFSAALELEPRYADARYNLAGTLAAARRYAEAIPHYEALVAQAPQSADVYSAFGKALWKCDRFEDAVDAFRRAIEIDPNCAEAHAYRGNALVEHGRFDEAAAAFQRALTIDPARPEFHRYLAEIRPESLGDDRVAALLALLQTPATRDDDRIDADFALARVYAHRGDPGRSFEHLRAANARRRRFIDYDEPATLSSFARIARVFDAGFLQSRAGGGDPSGLPVFIFGMPRSGTTLIEQILASHPQVHACGELTLLEETVNAVLGSGEPPTPEQMLAAGRQQLREIGRRYAGALAESARGATRATDKMPANFRFAGLLRIALPNARMIHACRDPLDTCLSCYAQYFGDEQHWAYDLGEIGRYYRGYAALMEHWRAVLPPGTILDVRYEDVVADLEGQARRIIDYCGLPWDKRCLSFHETDRPVRTASATQVRQPIYKSAIGRWRVYEEHLGPLLGALDYHV